MNAPVKPVVISLLYSALDAARGGQTALVIGENFEHARQLCNALVQMPQVQQALQHNQAKADQTNMVVDFWPGKQVRFFTTDHPDWEPARERMRGYPPSTLTIVVRK